MKKKVRFIDGLSESAWKSLAIKSLRIGWIEGLEAASSKLSPSTMKTMLIGSIFEDICPILEDLEDVHQMIINKDYHNLCSYDTHHGQGLSDKFCDLEDEAVRLGKIQMGYLMGAIIKKHSTITWINDRIANCVYTWANINPRKKHRAPLSMEFNGIPECIFDSHTFEGKMLGNNIMILSGHYENHRIIGKRVMEHGWSEIRNEFKNNKVMKLTKQATLF